MHYEDKPNIGSILQVFSLLFYLRQTSVNFLSSRGISREALIARQLSGIPTLRNTEVSEEVHQLWTVLIGRR
jgi:hypothetical protein